MAFGWLKKQLNFFVLLVYRKKSNKSESTKKKKLNKTDSDIFIRKKSTKDLIERCCGFLHSDEREIAKRIQKTSRTFHADYTTRAK